MPHGSQLTEPQEIWHRLVAVLHEARELGFLGPGPVSDHVAHSQAFAAMAPSSPNLAVDLGSGGGIPGLVLALVWPDSRCVLLDASQRRTEFLERAVNCLGLSARVTVIRQRAEVAGHDPDLRTRADLVVSRSFGPPAVTAECAAPLLRVGGHLIVAEPPGGDPARWPDAPLAILGLKPDGTTSQPWSMQSLVQMTPCPSRYPRRTGIPTKRPLFGTSVRS